MRFLGLESGARKVKHQSLTLLYVNLTLLVYFLICSGVPPGGWSSTGLSVETFDDTTITCTSTHLTSFAVLVDVSGASRVYYS